MAILFHEVEQGLDVQRQFLKPVNCLFGDQALIYKISEVWSAQGCYFWDGLVYSVGVEVILVFFRDVILVLNMH